jgi:hypothetical protein
MMRPEKPEFSLQSQWLRLSIKFLTTYDNYGVWGGREPPSSLFFIFLLFTCAVPAHQHKVFQHLKIPHPWITSSQRFQLQLVLARAAFPLSFCLSHFIPYRLWRTLEKKPPLLSISPSALFGEETLDTSECDPPWR